MENKVKKLFKRGTPQGALSYGIIAFLIGLLFVTVGFWKTIFIILLCAIAVFLGYSNNLENSIKKAINSIFPEKNKDIITMTKDTKSDDATKHD